MIWVFESGVLLPQKVFTHGPWAKFHYVLYDPLGVGIAVWAGPVSIRLDKRVIVRGWFNPLCNRQCITTHPLLDWSRGSVANALAGSQKIPVKMPPATVILACVLPDLPAITGLAFASIASTNHKQPVMISKDTRQAWNSCSSKLNLDPFHDLHDDP